MAIAGLLGIAGCAPSQPPTKGFMSGPAGQASVSRAPSGAPKPSPSHSSSENLPLGALGGQQQSSLEALRRGESAATSRENALKEIFFAFDQYDLDTEDRSVLRANADWLKKNPSVRVEVEGHSDERGTVEYNLALGAKRAQAAKDYLISLGVSADRISTVSYGEEIPACRSEGEDCWQKNRRDRFVMTAKGSAY
jgi:peptidoglycan-associated lipoprotein